MGDPGRSGLATTAGQPEQPSPGLWGLLRAALPFDIA
jgi:hypothetical protein